MRNYKKLAFRELDFEAIYLDLLLPSGNVCDVLLHIEEALKKGFDLSIIEAFFTSPLPHPPEWEGSGKPLVDLVYFFREIGPEVANVLERDVPKLIKEKFIGSEK